MLYAYEPIWLFMVIFPSLEQVEGMEKFGREGVWRVIFSS
jgi:hypothetical protein